MSRWLLFFLVLAGYFVVCSPASGQAPLAEQDREPLLVGRWREDLIVTPVNQVLTPWGRQLDLPGMRPQAIALSPDGKIAVTSGKTSELVVLDPASGEIRQRVGLPSEAQHEPQPEQSSANLLQPDRKGQVSYTGLIFSPDGRQIYLSNVNGSIKVFTVAESGAVKASHSFALPPAKAPRRNEEIPSGLACSPDGTRLYVCGNLSNQLLEIETTSGKVLRSIAVGVAPYDVRIAGQRAYVSNWGGRRPEAGDLIGPAGRGTTVRVDPVRHTASEGSLSVIDLDKGEVVKEILTGQHASALAVSPDQRYLVCANASDDHLSLIDLASLELKETIWVKRKPSDLWGCAPNALAFDSSGERLYVANGAQNAIAVLEFEPQEPGETKLLGLIPVGWFPGAVAIDESRKQLLVANIKGLPAKPKKQGDGSEGFNSHHYSGSLTLAPLPETPERLAELSERVARNQRYDAMVQAMLSPRPEAQPRAIPERIGEPSRIKHVVYVIKENRTYDQVFGALPRGRGRQELCIFGREITPNQHKLVEEFVLLDNTYCAGILSADGHQWSTTAATTDYLEKSFAGFPRSYPDGMGDDEIDALAYSPGGFIWDNALAHRISIRNYGEFMLPRVRWSDPNRPGTPDFLACYRAWQGQDQSVIFESEPGIESIREFSPTKYVGWNMSVPDQYRADFIINELREFERQGTLPQLIIICLPNDHTSGTSANCPTPAACIADNDLAFGRIVEAFSNSKFWPEMAIFGIEDDPQAGWDHVSGYRTTAYVASPYAKRGATVSTNYNTTSVLRTIEQILGMKPMNQFDASATPMFDCFVDEPNLTPFKSVPVAVPLDQMNAAPQAIHDPLLREHAEISAGLNFSEVDRCPEDVLNRILWHAQKGSSVPYPAWATSPDAEEEEEEEKRSGDR
ncbi:MAG: bifunctional YncE family protein/alkaline phosphatase family protein [Planctomycetota bacterium]